MYTGMKLQAGSKCVREPLGAATRARWVAISRQLPEHRKERRAGDEVSLDGKGDTLLSRQCEGSQNCQFLCKFPVTHSSEDREIAVVVTHDLWTAFMPPQSNHVFRWEPLGLLAQPFIKWVAKLGSEFGYQEKLSENRIAGQDARCLPMSHQVVVDTYPPRPRILFI
jgi:hypothetical protein